VEETVTLAAALSGPARPISWLDPPREVTIWDIKGLVASVLAAGGLTPVFLDLPPSEALADGTAARVEVGGTPAGRIGAVSQAARDRFGIKQEVFVAELSLSALWQVPAAAVSFRPLPRFPAVSRDLSLILPASREYRDVERTIAGIAPERIASVTLFDRYAGELLPAGKVGIGVRILFQDPERTLTSEEVNQMLDTIVEALGRELGATLRDSTGRL
jgi:phenylalanyl-tRNA synthetase beta chain